MSLILCICFAEGMGLLIGQVLVFGQLEEFVPNAYPEFPIIGRPFDHLYK